MQRKECETDCGNESIHCYTTYAGNLIVYASDPWYEAAKASFYDIDYARSCLQQQQLMLVRPQ